MAPLTTSHFARDCTNAPHTCEECGEKNHLEKHCLVRSDAPIPETLPAYRKKLITERRAAYKAKANGGAIAMSAQAPMTMREESVNFWASLDMNGFGPGI